MSDQDPQEGPIAKPGRGKSHANGFPIYKGGSRPTFTPEIEELFREMTEKQVDFVLYYSMGEDGVRGNATKSALKAGYSKESAGSQGSTLYSRPHIRSVIDILRGYNRQLTKTSFQDYCDLLLQQANSWKEADGSPKETPLVANGSVVMAEYPLYDEDGTEKLDKDGKPITLKRPIILQWRPNAANVRALELLGTALQYTTKEDGRAKGNNPKLGNRHKLPEKGYAGLPPGQLGAFLDKLPVPHLPPE